MVHADGTVDRKLGHKRRVEVDDPRAIWHTSLYLDEAEFEALAALAGRPLTKTRWAVDLADGRRGTVDEFTGPLTGLIMLEFDAGDPDELAAFEPPPWAGPEVTDHPALNGGALAGRTWADLADLVDQLRRAADEP